MLIFIIIVIGVVAAVALPFHLQHINPPPEREIDVPVHFTGKTKGDQHPRECNCLKNSSLPRCSAAPGNCLAMHN